MRQAGVVARAPRAVALAALLGLGAEGCGRAEAHAPPAGADCPAGTVATDAGCRSPAEAWTAPGGTAFVVAQTEGASDRNPGTAARPFRTISRALGAVGPGDAVVVRAGVYRESLRPRVGGREGAFVTVAAAPGAAVVVSGADPASDWEPLGGGLWRRAWPGAGLPTYRDDPTFRRELVVANGRVLRPVTDARDLAPGRFLVEGPPESPTAVRVSLEGRPGGLEIADRSVLFAPRAPDGTECGDAATPGYFRLVGLVFRHASNLAQHGAVCLGSAGTLVEDVRVEWTNGRGIDVSGRGHVVRRTQADLNGQLGWGGACRGCLIEDGSAVGNNWKGHDPFWEAGGIKLVRTTDTVVRRFYAAHNDGPGIWLDIDNDRNTVEGSLSVGNEVAGVMLEYATTRTLVQHNVVAGTRWRAWSGAGILSQAASANALVHNTVVANEGSGVWLRLDPDRRAPDGRNVVAGNRIVGNGTARVEGAEAREIQVEGTSRAHVRSTRFEANAYGRLGGRPSRSTFFVHPTRAPGGFRSEDLAAWRRLIGGDRDAQLVGPAEGMRVGRLGPVDAGAGRTAVVPYARAGADPSVVRAGGDWRNAPSRPAWPR